jgi:hypothetical protein
MKIALKKERDYLLPVDNDGPTIELMLGEKGSQITQEANLVLMVTMRPEGIKEGPIAYGSITTRGGWVGKIKTDTGEIKVRLTDTDGDGIYGNRIGFGALDMISFDNGKSPESIEDYYSMEQYCGKTILYDGKFYDFNVSKTGDSIEIKPYDGEMGTLKIEAKDGSGKPTDYKYILIYGDGGMYCLKSAPEIHIPPGKYQLSQATIRPKQSGVEANWFGVDVRSDKPFTVAKDQTAVLAIGGPLAIKIDSPVSIKRGQDLSINLAFTAGKDQTSGFEGSRIPKVTIKDAKGKVIKTANAEFG